MSSGVGDCVEGQDVAGIEGRVTTEIRETGCGGSRLLQQELSDIQKGGILG